MLRRYWITFDKKGDFPHYGGVFGFGVGVTAYNLSDAKQLMVQNIFKERGLPEIAAIIENVSYDQLDEDHVQPHMGIMVCRGIWWPRGYEYFK